MVVRAANAAVTLPTSTATRAGANTGPLPWCQEEPGGGEDEEDEDGERGSPPNASGNLPITTSRAAASLMPRLLFSDRWYFTWALAICFERPGGPHSASPSHLSTAWLLLLDEDEDEDEDGEDEAVSSVHTSSSPSRRSRRCSLPQSTKSLDLRPPSLSMSMNRSQRRAMSARCGGSVMSM